MDKLEMQAKIEKERKVIEEGLKEEIRRLNHARTESQGQEKKLAEIILKVNEAKKEVEPIRKEKIDLFNELEQARKDLSETRKQAEGLLKRLSDREKEFTQKTEEFTKYKQEEELKLELKRKKVAEAQYNADKTLSDANSKELSAVNEQKAAEGKIAEISLKIADFNKLVLEHKENMLEMAQKHAENETLSQKGNSALKEAEKLKSALYSKEKELLKREHADKVIEGSQNDRELALNLKDARLSKMQQDIGYLIETHNLKGKIK